MIDLKFKSIISANGSVVKDDKCIVLSGYNTEYGKKSYTKPTYYSFTFEGNFKMQDYFVLFYSCQGLRREYFIRKPFVFAITENGEQPLVCYDDISNDSRMHSIMIKTEKLLNCNGIKIQYAIDRRKDAYFKVYDMYTCLKNELPFVCSKGTTDKTENFETYDLSKYFNKSYSEFENTELIDGGRFFDKEVVSLYNIPFKINLNGNNMITPPPPPIENEDIIDNFGVPVIRKQARPISRDSLIELPVNSKLSELYFVMSMGGKRHKRWNYAQDGTALGALTGEVYMPLLVEDTVGFKVEIQYKNGNHDTALPLNLSLGRHGMSGDISVYGVPADENEEIEKIVFHNGLLDTDFSIIAVTLNKTEKRLHQEMLIPEYEDVTEVEIPNDKGISLNGNILEIKNAAISMEIDISMGMELVEMQNAFMPQMSVARGSMIRLRKGNEFIECFEPVSVDILGNKAEIVFKCDSLLFNATVVLCDDNDIKWQIRAENTGDLKTKTGILFPCILGIDNGSFDDNWYFVPKYRNILSNETAFVYEESSPGFPMQFMDVFSQKHKGGLSITTQERDTVTRIYSLDKSEKGIEIFVEYPEMYGEILPGQSFKCSTTVLTAHKGTWKKSYEIYKKWIDSWYKPYKCQDKDWYRKCFWLLTEYSDFVMEEKPINKLPLWNDTETGELKFKYVLEEQKKISGCCPDILHLWSSWVHRMENGVLKQKWGNYSTDDFEVYGGTERLKKALHEIIDDEGVNVSLYLHPTLLSECYPHTEHFFKNHKVINDIGDNITILDTTYRMCHAEEEWRNFVIDMYKNLYDTLKIPLLYVDEFSLRVENRCYNDKHSHSIPSSLLKTDIEFISRLREAMPEEVVLYGEYTAVDIYCNYIDCNISYYVTDILSDMIETSWVGNNGDDMLGKLYLNMYRFAFPKIVQLVLPTAMRNLSWHPQKFIFFNGEAIYDSLWDCEESTGQDFNTKSFKIKKQYADCFASDTPEGMIETLSPAICANCFPGENRTVYTLYNRAYTTYRGNVLKIPHKDGATYYDVWNDKELNVTIKDDFAEINLSIDAQEVGCILVSE